MMDGSRSLSHGGRAGVSVKPALGMRDYLVGAGTIRMYGRGSSHPSG